MNKEFSRQLNRVEKSLEMECVDCNLEPPLRVSEPDGNYMMFHGMKMPISEYGEKVMEEEK
jgi:hypothetical protein